MKKHFILFIILIFFFHKIESQNTSQFYYNNTSIIDSKVFPTIIYFNDSILKGYGSFHSTDLQSIKFSKNKPSDDSQENMISYSLSQLKKVEVLSGSNVLSLRPIKLKGIKKSFFIKEFENESVILYSYKFIHPTEIEIYETKKSKFPMYALYLKKSNKFKRIGIKGKRGDKSKSIFHKTFKVFEDCPELYVKIKEGNFKRTYEDFIQILNLYNSTCNKN